MCIPRKIEDISSQWLTKILRDAGKITLSYVTGYLIKKVNTNISLTSNIYKVYIEYDEKENGQPNTLIIKMASIGNLFSIFYELEFYQSEINYYKKIAQRNNVLKSPECYACYCDESGSVLVIQDLSSYSNFSQYEGCPIEFAYNMVKQLALYHIQWFDEIERHRNVFTGWNEQQLRFSNESFLKRWYYLLDNFPDCLPDEYKNKGDILNKNYIRIWNEIREGIVSLIHFDLRLDNIFFDKEGNVASVIDWQLIRVGNIVYDLSLFLVGNLEVKNLKKHLSELIQYYYDTMCKYSECKITSKQFMKYFKKSLLCHFYREINYLGNENYSYDEKSRYIKNIFNRYLYVMQDYNIISMLSGKTVF